MGRALQRRDHVSPEPGGMRKQRPPQTTEFQRQAAVKRREKISKGIGEQVGIRDEPSWKDMGGFGLKTVQSSKWNGAVRRTGGAWPGVGRKGGMDPVLPRIFRVERRWGGNRGAQKDGELD